MTKSLRSSFSCLMLLAACMGEKPNGLRADSTGAASAPAITGINEDQVKGRLWSASGGKSARGSDYAQFNIAKSDGSRQAITVEPWPVALPQCQSGECAAEAEKLQFPDGVEQRVTVMRKGQVVTMAVQKSRLRQLPGRVPFKLVSPAGRKTATAGGRIGVDLRVGEVLVERGKTTSLRLDGRECSLHLYDASIAAEGRPGIAEESPDFTASWVLYCK